MAATLIQRVKEDLGAAIFPITVDAYHSMMRSGILREGDPIELIDGIIVRKDRGDRGGELVQGTRHAAAISRLERILRPVEALGGFRRIQVPVTLAPTQEPEPDVSVILGKEDDFVARHPGPKDIAALVEVAHSSLNYDRTTKQAIYAAVRIPIYWIVNLVEGILEVYTQPRTDEPAYADRTDFRSGESVSLEVSPGQVLVVAVSELFPPTAE